MRLLIVCLKVEISSASPTRSTQLALCTTIQISVTSIKLQEITCRITCLPYLPKSSVNTSHLTYFQLWMMSSDLCDKYSYDFNFLFKQLHIHEFTYLYKNSVMARAAEKTFKPKNLAKLFGKNLSICNGMSYNALGWMLK